MKTKLTALIAATLMLGTAATAQAGDYNERDYYDDAYYQNNNGVFGTVIGGVMGGLLGSTLGKGNGRLVATAAGAVIGGTIGHAVSTADDRTPVPARRVTVVREVEKEVVYRPVVRKVYVEKKVYVERPARKVVVIHKGPKRDHKHYRKARYEERRAAWKNRRQVVTLY